MLQGKRILVTGVLNDASIAFSTARLAQEQGAEVVLSSFGRVMRLTERTAKRLPEPRRADRGARRHRARTTSPRWPGNVGGKLDGVVHCLAFAPESCLGGGFLDAPWDDVAVALQVSAYSLKALAVAALPLMEPGRVDRRPRLRQRRRRLAGLRLDGRVEGGVRVGGRGTSPATSGPKGIRVNLVGAGPLPEHRGQEHPRASSTSRRSGPSGRPLGWDLKDAEPVAKACVALLSDWFPATTGEMVHVDGGFHAVGA